MGKHFLFISKFKRCHFKQFNANKTNNGNSPHPNMRGVDCNTLFSDWPARSICNTLCLKINLKQQCSNGLKHIVNFHNLEGTKN